MIDIVNRQIKKEVKIGDVIIGGNNPIAIQSMTNISVNDIEKNVAQILAFEKAGCDIARVAVPDLNSVSDYIKIMNRVNIPVVADIHFNHNIAIKCIESGACKIRINPGNIGGEKRVKEVVDVAKKYNAAIRIGVNTGSLEKELLEKYNSPCVDALVESALKWTNFIENLGFKDIVVSLKSSSVVDTIEAYRKATKVIDYPLHTGVTEAGTKQEGIIKSSVGIGTLLAEGIGDTIRVSLTGDPVKEVEVGVQILKSLGLRRSGVNIVSCPTCGRCKINLEVIVDEITDKLKDYKGDIKVAVMGCIVNGPGEAREADIGVAGGDGVGLIFKKGEIIKKVKEEDIVTELIKHIRQDFK